MDLKQTSITSTLFQDDRKNYSLNIEIDVPLG